MKNTTTTVGLFTSVYFNNIGNAFIDLGAELALKQALPDTHALIKISQCANFAASMSRSFSIKENPIINWIWTHLMEKYAKRLHDKSYRSISVLDVNSVPAIINLDYLIIPGCVLTVPFFSIYKNLLKKKVIHGCKLIFLGASGNHYTNYEIKFVTNSLRELKPLAIITRDSIAYEQYSKLAQYSYNGIDNVFFLNKLEIPYLSSDPESFVIVNLEESKHQKLKLELTRQLKKRGKNVIYTDHKPFPYNKVSKLVKKGVIISDFPLDYLVLYKNAEAVYSDRVHACIPTLSFGNKAMLFSDSPRKALFANVGIKAKNGNPMQIFNLEELQNKQIMYLKQIFLNEKKD